MSLVLICSLTCHTVVWYKGSVAEGAKLKGCNNPGMDTDDDGNYSKGPRPFECSHVINLWRQVELLIRKPIDKY